MVAANDQGNTLVKKEKGIFPAWQIFTAFSFFAVALVLVIFHIITFAKTELSKDPTMWGVFGDFYNVVFSIINTAITGLLTYAVYALQKKRDMSDKHRDLWEQKFLTLQETPSLIFFSHDGESYRLYNMGKGTANNVIFANHKANSAEIGPPIKTYSIPPNCYVEIEAWTQNAHRLYAFYESVAIAEEKPQRFLTICVGDQNQQIKDDKITAYLNDKADRQPGIKLGTL